MPDADPAADEIVCLNVPVEPLPPDCWTRVRLSCSKTSSDETDSSEGGSILVFDDLTPDDPVAAATLPNMKRVGRRALDTEELSEDDADEETRFASLSLSVAAFGALLTVEDVAAALEDGLASWVSLALLCSLPRLLSFSS